MSEENKDQEIIAELEEKFKDRYTENDEDYKAELDKKEASPPVVNFGSSDRHSREHDRRKRSRSRSRSPSRSKSPATLKRKGMYGCYSYFVFYY